MTNNTQDIPFLGLFGINNKNDLLDSLSNVTNYLSSQGFSTYYPSSLYRYGTARHAKDEIKNHYIHLSPVSKLSDPYDSLIPALSILKKSNLYSSIYKDTDDSGALLKEIPDIIKEFLTICCFAEDYKSFPMWDHYANQYTGVCIEYDCSKLIKYAAPFKVKYSKKAFASFPKKANNEFEFLMSSLVGCVLTKNNEYSYEKEWRYFNGSFENEIDIKDSINRVYLGDKCVRYSKQIIQICQDNNIEVIRLKTCRDKYDFEEENLT